MANPNTRKSCIVPKCISTTSKTPEKLFFQVPIDPKMRKKWLNATKRAVPIAAKSCVYCCEDHFDVENDMENYVKYKLVGGKLRLKKGVVPHKFACQKNLVEKPERSVVKKLKIARLKTSLSECIASTSHNVEEIFIVDSIPRVQDIVNDPIKDVTRDENLSSTTEDILKRKHEKIQVNPNTAEASSSSLAPSIASKTQKRVPKKRKLDDSGGEKANNGNDNDYDSWAKECARELKQMDPDQQIFAKKAISIILKEGLLGRLHENYVLKIIRNAIQTTEKTSDLLDEYLVIHKKSQSRPAAVCREDRAPSDLSPSVVDIGASSVSLSRKKAVRPPRAKSKPSNKTKVPRSVTASSKIKSSVGLSSLGDIGSSSIVTSNKTASPVGSLSFPAQTCDDTEPSSHECVALGNSPSLLVKPELCDESECYLNESGAPVDPDPLLVKGEPCDETESSLLSASNKSAVSARSSPLLKSEPNSPPPSPDVTVIVKYEPE